MHVEGITWHAIVLEADEFAATKKLLVETFGLTPALARPGAQNFLELVSNTNTHAARTRTSVLCRTVSFMTDGQPALID
jgi:hypothetical protein